MATGLWTSVAGASTQAQNVDIIANNLANSDTLAFKKDLPTFKEYLSVIERDKSAADIPRAPIKDKDFYPLDGRDQAFVVMNGTHTNYRQGNIRVTQSPLDIALDGNGFLEISTPQGTRFTRQGSLKVAMDGRLVTSDGNPVLSAQAGGTPIQPQAQGGSAEETQGRVAAELASNAGRYINLRDRGPHLTITQGGEIYAGDDLIAKLSVVEFQDLKKIHKIGASQFENPDPQNVAVGPSRTQVRQGMLETSNVNPIEEMTNLIKANRLFEHDLKAMKTYGDLMQREANDIGKL